MFKKKLFALGFLVVAMLFLISSVSFADELSDIQKAIKAKGAKWVAGETSISKLPLEEKNKRLGLIKPKIKEETILPDQELSYGEQVAVVPASFDWRANGGNYVTSVKDQGGCGSCWAFATTAALESTTLIAQETPYPYNNLDSAEQILVSCSGAGSCTGGYIDSASKFIRDTGLPGESYFPYTATNNNCSNAVPGWQLYTDKITSWNWVATLSPTVDVIKNALYNYGPLVTTMVVYQDFDWYRGGVYSHVSGSKRGNHAVLIIGYDEADTDPSQHYFIAKNSWGTLWGESGFFRIAYSELTSVVKFGQYTIRYAISEPPPPPTCTYSINPTSASFQSDGGSGNVNVSTTESNCSWTAVSNDSWIIINSGNSGTGTGTVMYSVSPNVNTNSRNGTMTIAGKTFTVSQEGVPPPSPSITIEVPNGGERWKAGTTQTIRWSYTGNPGSYVKIELLKAGQLSSTLSSRAKIGNRSYNWRINRKQAADSDYKIQITSTTNSAINGTSDNYFTIYK